MIQWLCMLITFAVLTGFCCAQDRSEATESSSGPVQSGSDENQMPLPNSLDTDLPLQIVMSPLHWGSFSLLSLTAYEGYDTNPTRTQVPSASEFSAFNAFLVYSIRHEAWELDLQYEPSVVASPGVIAKNLTGNAADFQAARRLSATWTLAIGNHFRYSPDLQSTIQGNSLALNLGGGISVEVPFLQSNESLLFNTAGVTLSHRVNSMSSLTFTGDQTFIRLSPSIDLGIDRQLPVVDAESANASVGYSRVLGSRDTINFTYDYRAQFASTATGTAQYDVASASWGHVLTQGLRLSLSGGPGFFNPGSSGQWRTTIQGSVQLGKSYRDGTVGVAFSRNNSFNGVVSNNFANHYALLLDQHFGPRVRLTANASYVQQQFSGGYGQNGTLASIEPAWMVSRNWSVFGQLRYVVTRGGEFPIAPQKIYTAGIRWSWVPEKP
jgi:hypothetical protein